MKKTSAGDCVRVNARSSWYAAGSGDQNNLGGEMGGSCGKTGIDQIVGIEVAPEKRSEYMKLLEIHNLNRVDYNTRKWETLKYFQSIVLAFLGGTIVAFTAGIDKGLFCKSVFLSVGFAGVLSVLPIVASVAAVPGNAQLRRERARLLQEGAQGIKISQLL